MVISGTQAGSGRYHYLDQVLKPAEPRIVSRYVESAMSGQLVLSAGAHRRTRQQRFLANCRCYVKDESRTAFTNDLPNKGRSAAAWRLASNSRAPWRGRMPDLATPCRWVTERSDAERKPGTHRGTTMTPASRDGRSERRAGVFCDHKFHQGSNKFSDHDNERSRVNHDPSKPPKYALCSREDGGSRRRSSLVQDMTASGSKA
jgi:hypothetical protein